LHVTGRAATNADIQGQGEVVATCLYSPQCVSRIQTKNPRPRGKARVSVGSKVDRYSPPYSPASAHEAPRSARCQACGRRGVRQPLQPPRACQPAPPPAGFGFAPDTGIRAPVGCCRVLPCATVAEPAAPRTSAPFLRDVAVNVVANLVAAAVIYLVGVLAGVFPREPRVILAAVAVLLFSAALSLTVLLSRLASRARRNGIDRRRATTFYRIGAITFATLAASAVAMSILEIRNDFGMFRILPIWLRAIAAVPVVAVAALSIVKAMQLWRKASRVGEASQPQ
jgi:hypothetical protein